MKKYIIAAGFLVVILLGTLIGIITTEDKTGPVIAFASSNVSYMEEDNYDSLLEDVSAIDKKDGDVSETLVIASIVPLANHKNVMITYAAKDNSNNVTRAERLIECNTSVVKSKIDGNVIEVDNNTSVTSNNSKNNKDNVSNLDNKSKDVQASKPDNSVKDDKKADDKEAVLGNNHSSVNNDRNDADKDVEDVENPTSDESYNDSTEAMIEYPRIKLKTHEVEVEVGSDFDVLTYVESVEDDKDSTDTVWGRIRIVGTFDMHKTGNYAILYYTTDKDGNRSNCDYLWIKVK